tara:strand:- start:447 stop:1937 length:1491 start_codon:yes stop_codon:yes gene_type:complete
MSKTNFFVKYLKNINNFINNLLEENLNKLNFKNFSFLLKNNKIILTFVALLVIFISYLLLPTFYKQNDITKLIKKDLQSKFDLDFKFSDKINYNFFPRPHFTIVNASISDDKNEISKIDNLKIFISFNNLFSIKNIELKNVILKNANFDLNSKNYNFFLDLMNKNFQNGKMIIKDSNVFFRNIDGEVLFINKIFYMKYYYESKELKNIFYSENEIFNIPFSVESFFEDEKNKIFSLINLNLMKLKIENELKIQNDKKTGNSQFISNKFKRIVEYQIEQNSFNFHLFDKLDQPDVTYKGKFNFKPFYGSIEGYLDEINLNYLFGSYAVISQLLKTEIFNNKNINFKLNINANSVNNKSNFRNINLNSKIQDGLIDTDNTKFKWKDVADFELLESLIFVRDGELVLDGKLNIDIKNHNKIYKFLLTPKKYRNQIKQVNFNFTYNFDQKIAELKDFKIDNKIDQSVSKILNNIILKKDDLSNKIYFKNLLNEAIKSYAG